MNQFTKLLLFFSIIMLCKTRNIISGLADLCPKVSNMEVEYSKSVKNFNELNSNFETNKEEPIFDYELTLTNLRSFGDAIIKGLKPVGNGSFGVVFVKPYLTDKFDKSIQSPTAIKLLSILNDSEVKDRKGNKEGLEQQTSLIKEITNNNLLSSIDPLGLYIPKIRECVNITDSFDRLYDDNVNNSNVDSSQLKLLKHKKSKDFFAIYTEELNICLFDYINLTITNAEINNHFSLNIRLDMATALVKGLKLMNTVMLHCDIKPENIMLKKLEKSEIEILQQNNVPTIDLFPNTTYQAKYIDFGLSMKYGESDLIRPCVGGTPRYLPAEFTQKTDVGEYDHSEVDIFSLGLTLLDIETLNLELESYSDVQEVVMKKILNNQTEFTDEEIEDLNKIELISYALQAFKYPEFTDKFKEELRGRNENFNSIIDKLNGFLEDEDDVTFDPSKYLFHDVSMFQHVFHMALNFFLGNSFSEEDKNVKLKPFKEELQELEFTFGESELSDISDENKDLVEYLLAQINVIEADFNWYKLYIKYLFFMVHPDFEFRSDAEGAAEYLGTLRELHAQELDNSLHIINEYELKFDPVSPNIADLAIAKINSGELTGSRHKSMKNITNEFKEQIKLII